MYCLIKGLFVLAAGHEDSLRAEHFRHFSKDCGTSLSYNPVREASQKRICGDSRESVGSATFQTDLKLAYRHILASVILSGLCDFTKKIQSMLHLVALDLL